MEEYSRLLIEQKHSYIVVKFSINAVLGSQSIVFCCTIGRSKTSNEYCTNETCYKNNIEETRK